MTSEGWNEGWGLRAEGGEMSDVWRLRSEFYFPSLICWSSFLHRAWTRAEGWGLKAEVIFRPTPDLAFYSVKQISLLILHNRKMEEVRGKMEDVISHRNLHLSSCILLLISLLILHNHRKGKRIVYHQGNRCDVRGQSSTRILLLLSMLWSSCS